MDRGLAHNNFVEVEIVLVHFVLDRKPQGTHVAMATPLQPWATHRLDRGGVPAVRAAVVEVDLPGLGDGGGLVEVHQLVEGRELLRPQEVLAFVVLHHLEVLDVALVPEGGEKQR